MGENTNISWCDHTFNPWIGCTKVSPACDGCYAEALMDKRYGRVEWGAPGKGNGTRVRTSPANWRQPVLWNRAAEAAGCRPLVFCASLADVFDNQASPEWRRDLFDLIRATPHLVWLMLTKRPQNIVRLYGEAMLDPPDGGSGYPWPSNAAIGTTVEDQKRADINVPALLEAKATLNPAFAFLSCEPLLGPIDLTEWLHALEWIITGGETDQGGHPARPWHPDWPRGLRNQCAAYGRAYHHKQNGEYLPGTYSLSRHTALLDPSDGPSHGLTLGAPPHAHVHEWGDGYISIRVGKKRAGRLLDGQEHNARPEVRA